MSPWTNKYTCPGWMFVPRKPHPFGNEYHSVCCSMSGIMWEIELVEGKDAPCAAAHPKPKHNNHGNTVGLLLHILQPIFTKGYVVVLDSGFCVLKGIVELKKRECMRQHSSKSIAIGRSTSRVMTLSHTLMTRMLAIATLGRDRWMRLTFMFMP